MTKITKTLLSFALILSAPLVFACDYPAPPKSLPDGNTSTKDEMLAGVKFIAAYQEDMSTYLACIESEEVLAVQALGDDDDAKKQRSLMFGKKYNAAVEEQTRTVEKFNAEIRAYKARSN